MDYITDEMLTEAYFKQYKTMQSVAEKHCLNEPDLNVILALGMTGAVSRPEQVKRISFTDLSRRLFDFSANSAVSYAANRLSKSGILTKKIKKDDRRVPELSLTDKGEKIYREVVNTYRNSTAEISGLGELVRPIITYEI